MDSQNPHEIFCRWCLKMSHYLLFILMIVLMCQKIGITSPQLELEYQISYLLLSNSMNLVYFDLLYQDFRTELILILAQVLHNHPH